jgi:hypothetical protein
MSAPMSILLYGHDQHLLRTRQMLLQGAGYRTMIATNLAEIDRLSHYETIDLLILCHSLTLEECGRALALAQSRWPFMRSLMLSAMGSWCFEEASVQVFDTTQGPAKLLVAVNHLFDEESRLHSHLY